MLKTFSVINREFRYILSNRRLLLILLVTPLLYTVLFGILYNNHVVSHMTTAVYDLNHTGLSRQVIQAFSDSNKFDLVADVSSEQEMKELLDQRKVMSAIVIPKNFDRDIKRGNPTEIMVAVSGSNLLISNGVLNAASEIVQTLSAGVSVKVLESQGYLPDKASRQAMPVSFRLRVWYNPTFNYANFLLLGLIATIIQQVALLYMAIAIAREKEHNTLSELLEKDYNSVQIVIGKIIPYFIVNLITANTALYFCFSLFQVPFRGSLPVLLALEAVFMVGILSLGVLFSIVCRNELEATQLAMLLAVPSFLFSGYTWPYHSMTPIAQAVSSALPLSYFASNLRDIALIGVGYREILPDLKFLIIMSVVLLPLSIAAFHFKHVRSFKKTGVTAVQISEKQFQS